MSPYTIIAPRKNHMYDKLIVTNKIILEYNEPELAAPNNWIRYYVK